VTAPVVVKTYTNSINGHWVRSESGATVKDINPANREEILCEVQGSTPADMVHAMEAETTSEHSVKSSSLAENSQSSSRMRRTN
jgi:acyl-CoA reductase-like NAD-dependent aldehyde dehydrogenase